MEIFWTLIEPILATFPARRICEVGVAGGAFTVRLLAWAQDHNCKYIGIDPKIGDDVVGSASGTERADNCEILKDYSLAVLPTLDRCDVYFLDGDHNFFTVRSELTLITDASCGADNGRPGPLIFIHDVGWPWGRRDMYYLPSVVPANARHPWSETLGVPLEGDELVDGGLREPGRYAIAVSAHGPRNGVLTAVEDFLAGSEGSDWSAIILPVAFGLAILYRPEDVFLAVACRERLRALKKAAATTAQFLQACEQNYLQLYLHGEYSQHLAATAARDLQSERTAHYATLSAYADLERAYGELLTHNRALENEYDKLLQAYHSLQIEGQGLPIRVEEAAGSAHAL